MATGIDPLIVKQIQAAYEAGFTRCMSVYGKLRPYMSLKEAYDTYGRSTVTRWIDEGLVNRIKDGTGTSRCRINREQIAAVASASNRESWFEHHENDPVVSVSSGSEVNK